MAATTEQAERVETARSPELIEPSASGPPGLVWMFLRTVVRLVVPIWLQYRVRGLDRMPPTGGPLLAATHQSFLAPPLVGTPLPRSVSFLARDSLFRVPVVGWIMRHLYVIPINRESASSSSLRVA